MSREDETACAAAFGAAGELVGTADAREEEAVFGAGAPDELSSRRPKRAAGTLAEEGDGESSAILWKTSKDPCAARVYTG